jgi:hypothetical protein
VIAPDDDHRGDAILRASWIGTALYAAVAALTTITASFVIPLVAVTSVLFVIGLVAFLVAYVIAIGRSREVLIGMGGLFFLAGSTAPARVRRHLMGSFAAQVAVATASASVGVARFPADATNPLAFGFLTSLYGLGLAGLWGARFGVFAPRPPEQPRDARRRPMTSARSDDADDPDDASARGDEGDLTG